MDELKIIQDYLDKYHSGEISEADFQQRLKSNTALQEEFKRYKKDLQVIRAAAKKQLRKKAALSLEAHEQIPTKFFSIRRLLQIAAAIAMLIASVFIVQHISSPESTADLFASHFELPDPAAERNATPQTETWNQAMIAYTNKDFEKAIELITPLLDQNDFLFPDRGKLYLGLSHLMENHNQQAIDLFAAISVESSYVQDAEWYQALAFLKMDNVEEAKKAFQKIVDQPRHFKQKEALEILKNLK